MAAGHAPKAQSRWRGASARRAKPATGQGAQFVPLWGTIYGDCLGPGALRLPLQRPRFAFMINNMKSQFDLFEEAVGTIRLMEETALKWRSLSSLCQEVVATSQDLLARSPVLLNQDSGEAVATAMGRRPRG